MLPGHRSESVSVNMGQKDHMTQAYDVECVTYDSAAVLNFLNECNIRQ